MDENQNDNAQDQGENITQAETNDVPVTGETATDAGDSQEPETVPASE